MTAMAGRFPTGALVRFTYGHGQTEDGIVSSVNERTVFVRFLKTPQGCDPENLRVVDVGEFLHGDLLTVEGREAVATGLAEPPPAAIPEDQGPGIPRLLEHLSSLSGENVFLWYTPPPAGDDIRWRVWTGAPNGSGGGEWGRGPTAWKALHEAFERVTGAIFKGRIPR